MAKIKHHVSDPDQQCRHTRPSSHLGQGAADHFKQTDLFHQNQIDIPILPRWRFMTPQARAQTQRIAISVVALLIGAMLIRQLLPLIGLLVLGWWVWGWIRRR